MICRPEHWSCGTCGSPKTALQASLLKTRTPEYIYSIKVLSKSTLFSFHTRCAVAMMRLATVLAAAAAVAEVAALSASGLTVQTTGGTVQGYETDLAYAFTSIPYAKPPVGPLRWKNPEPAVPWSGVLQATSGEPWRGQGDAAFPLQRRLRLPFRRPPWLPPKVRSASPHVPDSAKRCVQQATRGAMLAAPCMLKPILARRRLPVSERV